MTILRVSLATGALALFLLSGIAFVLPLANAQSTVAVTIPLGANSPSNPPGYSPDTVTVVIGVNNTVTWMNNDLYLHTVTPETAPAGSGWGVGSGDLTAGQSYSFTFTVPGTYTYTCVYHSWMTGTVVVKGASTTPTPEFPAASLAVILFAAIAAVMVAASRLRASVPPHP